jgi:hypothetical protein
MRNVEEGRVSMKRAGEGDVGTKRKRRRESRVEKVKVEGHRDSGPSAIAIIIKGEEATEERYDDAGTSGQSGVLEYLSK